MRFTSIFAFIENHWGDLCALYLLHLGIYLVVRFHGNDDVAHIGESLVLAGVATMRFRGVLNGSKNLPTNPNPGTGATK